MPAYIFALGLPKEQKAHLKAARKRTAMLIDGAHHCRELTTISMVTTIMVKFLHAYVHLKKNKTTAPEYAKMYQDLLTKHSMIFMPVVNVDGFTLIDKTFKKTGKLVYQRKNRRPTKKDCGDLAKGVKSYGVDLNRNYGFAWGTNNAGSSTDPCSDAYRGAGPFSEPETQNMRDFVISFPKMKFAINFHAYGNLLVMPFNADNQKNPLVKKFYKKAYNFYKALKASKVLPKGNKLGNGSMTVNYEANGEASDWMLSERGIIAMSPELGIADQMSNQFFIRQPKLVKKVIFANLPWINSVL